MMMLRNSNRMMINACRFLFLPLLLAALFILAGCAHRGSTGDIVYGIWRLSNYEEFEALCQEAGGSVDGYWCFDVNVYDGSGTLGSSIATELTLYNDGSFLAVCNNDNKKLIKGAYSIKDDKITLSDIQHGDGPWSANFSLSGSEDFAFEFSGDTLSITGSAGTFQFIFQRYDSAAAASDSGKNSNNGRKQENSGTIGGIIGDLFDSDPIAGIYEEGDTTWSFAKDGTLRIQTVSIVYLGSWYLSETDSNSLVIKCDYGHYSGGMKVQYEQHGDVLEFFWAALTGQCLDSLRKIGAAPKTVGFVKNQQPTLCGVYQKANNSASYYSFYSSGEFEYTTVSSWRTRVMPGKYKIAGNELTILFSEGTIETYIFERNDDGLILFFEGIDHSGYLYPLIRFMDSGASPTPFPEELTRWTSTGCDQDPAGPMGSIEVWADGLSIRQSPNLNGEVIGIAREHDKFNLYYYYEYNDGYTWYNIGPNAWIGDDSNFYVMFDGDILKDTAPYTTPAASATPTPTFPPVPTSKMTEKPEEETGREENQESETTLYTDYYSVTIPAAISARCVCRQHWDGISLYEITSVLDGCGGNFFSLIMYAADDFSFLDNPTIVSYQGMLTAQNGERYNLFFCQPTDVQWSSAGYDNFVACSDCAEKILASLRPLNGVTITKPKELNPQSKQVVFVSTYEYNGQYGARLCVAEWTDEAWKTRLSDIVASIGSNGTTTDKHEGDHCTPSGTFNILFCFSDRTLETGLRQKTLRDGDVWVTDQNSRYYNTIQSDSARYKDWTKSENIYRQLTSGRSVAGIFFDYNGDGETAGSATPGAEAALFLDGVGISGDLYTGYGDIKLTGEDLLQLLKVLDSSLNPVIIIDSAD